MKNGGGKNGGGKNGGGKNGGGKGTGRMPQGLHGMASRTPEGDPICFNYNLAGCNATPPCPKGKLAKGLD